MRNLVPLVLTTLLTAPALLGQQPPAETQPMPMPPGHSMHMHPGAASPDPMQMDCQAMIQKMQDRQAAFKAMDDRLAALVEAMNKAKGSAKVERLAAVVNEMVAQREQMRDGMAVMMPQMMSHITQHAANGMMAGMQSMADCPMMRGPAPEPAGHAAHHAGVMERGAEGMGFDQEKTTHHFILLDTGGRIEVTANDAADTRNTNAIRAHITHIATAFAQGDFALPMFIHDQTPPGVADMKRLQSAIAYRYEEIPRGARVVITTSNPGALNAVHDFLRFQIKDHGTGDPLTISDGS